MVRILNYFSAERLVVQSVCEALRQQLTDVHGQKHLLSFMSKLQIRGPSQSTCMNGSKYGIFITQSGAMRNNVQGLRARASGHAC